jgi:hypothetical protein
VKTDDHNSGGALGWVRSWFFPGGERVVSAFGMWVALLVMGVMLAGGAWTFYVHREATRRGVMSEATREAEVLAAAVERLIEGGGGDARGGAGAGGWQDGRAGGLG